MTDDSPDALSASIYDDLRRDAARAMRSERRDHTLDPTALVNEAWVKLMRESAVPHLDRHALRALMARRLRQVLADHATRRRTLKRGGGGRRQCLGSIELISHDRSIDLLDLEDAMVELERLEPRQAAVVELRCYGGCTIEETANTLGVSVSTVKNDWAFLLGWLRSRLGGAP